MRKVQAARPDIEVVAYFNLDTWVTALRMNLAYLVYKIWYAWYPYYPDRTQYPWVGTAATKLTLDHIFLWQKDADGNKKGAEYGVQSRDIDRNWSRDSLFEFYKDWGVNIPKPDDPPPPDNKAEWLAEKQAVLFSMLTRTNDLALDITEEIQSLRTFAEGLVLPTE